MRLIRESVHKLHIPPSYWNYQYLSPETPQSYVKRTQLKNQNEVCHFQLIEGSQIDHAPLPRNIDDRERLSKERGPWGFSFYDVPERRLEESFIARMSNCQIVCYQDSWGQDFYAITTYDDRILSVRGTGFHNDEHKQLIRLAKEKAHVKQASWILEEWSNNYFHWLVRHLPKLLLLETLELADQIMLPQSNALFPVIETTLASIGVLPNQILRFETTIFQVDELTVVGLDLFPGSLLCQLREKFSRPFSTPPYRKVFISRRNASRRRLVNEQEIWNVLQTFGFERIVMEDLSFNEQISLMKETMVIFGLHGAGLTNMLFAPPGIHVIEILDPQFPAPLYYALACALGHHYWLLNGVGVGDAQGVFKDMFVDLSSVREIVREVENALR